MQSGTSTIECPECGRPAVLRLLQHTDEQGHPLKHELTFHCQCGHHPSTADVARIGTWSPVVALD